MSISPAAINERIAHVRERIAEAARRGGRDPSDVLLVAVTKTHGLPVIEAACRAGLRHFGENRVEEARDKIAEARVRLPPDVTWHMVGHIQSRKTASVAALFEWVHSIDRLKIARRLSHAAGEAGRSLDALLEVNLSGEETKYGYDLSRWPDDESQAEGFFSEVQEMLGLPALRLHGLMTVAPFTDDPETVRPIFRRMRLLRDALRERFPAHPWPHLSMGMSADYEVAIEEGATIVRLGTALFGPREYGPPLR
ncbi:MAG TPA: YggS family pyridoxal phosphate-dependent enzyme [Chloroflexi bacterium]|nr:YggS family pyridoxal phosphate-dependent enzyme [Chloroflexota bacterium]